MTQFLKSAHGDSYVISSGPRSGRMQLIDSVLEKHERNNKFIVNRLKIGKCFLVFGSIINSSVLGYIGSDTNALSLLELESVDLVCHWLSFFTLYFIFIRQGFEYSKLSSKPEVFFVHNTWS